MRKYTHYGTKFTMEKFEKIRNIPMHNKPAGGFWASPDDAEFSWKDWNECSEYTKCDESNAFHFHLVENARVLRLDNLDILKQIPIQEERPFADLLGIVPDFEALAKEYDAIEYSQSKIFNALYGWDCDSIVVLNPKVIVRE